MSLLRFVWIFFLQRMAPFPYLPMLAIMVCLVSSMVVQMSVFAYAGYMVEHLGVVDNKDESGNEKKRDNVCLITQQKRDCYLYERGRYKRNAHCCTGVCARDPRSVTFNLMRTLLMSDKSSPGRQLILFLINSSCLGLHSSNEYGRKWFIFVVLRKAYD